MKITKLIPAVPLVFACVLPGTLRAEPPGDGFRADPELAARGRNIAIVSGCNDCHSPGYAPSDGNTPEDTWLTGDGFGWMGPWGTTYGTNLRIFVGKLSEDQWVDAARSLRRRPPMPWFNLNHMEENDLRALYHYIRSLGAPGEPAPAALAPDVEPSAPHARWVLNQNQ